MTEMQPHTDTNAITAPVTQSFTREQIELVKRTVAKGTNDDELALFLEVAKRRQLDPFSGQIHAVMRWDSRENRETMTMQVGLHGQRAIASRTHLHEYTEGPVFTADGETWTDTWLAEEPPAAAACEVKRRDQSRPHRRVVLWSEYAQTKRDGSLTSMWASLGVTMLGKVAEVHALRAAFPDELGAFYAPEEMDQSVTPPADDEQDAPEIDHPDERRDLHARWMAYWKSLDEDEQGAVWKQIGGRFYGDGGWGDRFAATPLHVLQEIVEQAEEDGEDDDPDGGGEPDDEPLLPTDDGVADASVDEDDTPDEQEDPAPAPERPEPAASDRPAPTGRVLLADVYDDLNHVQVARLVKDGSLTTEAFTVEATPHEVWTLEQDRPGDFRKTVKGALDLVGYRNGTTKAVGDDG